jgi:hypothetical protein
VASIAVSYVSHGSPQRFVMPVTVRSNLYSPNRFQHPAADIRAFACDSRRRVSRFLKFAKPSHTLMRIDANFKTRRDATNLMILVGFWFKFPGWTRGSNQRVGGVEVSARPSCVANVSSAILFPISFATSVEKR